MSIMSCTKTHKPIFSSLYSRLKAGFEHVHEFLTHQREPQQKIEALNKRLFAVESKLCTPQTLTAGLVELKDVLVQEAHLHNQHFSNRKVRKTYADFCKNLERVKTTYASPESMDIWLNTNHNRQDKEKLLVYRWLQSSPSQRHFAAHYKTPNVPLKFSEIPTGSILITYPYAYIRHMRLERKTPLFKTIYFLFKAFLARILTGKQFSHVSLSMGNGKIFDLDQGRGQIKNFGDKIFYGIVKAPNEREMLASYHQSFSNANPIDFSELTGKINAEITTATTQKRLRHNIISIIRTSINLKRPKDYRCTEAWKAGKCHFSCSATTSALLSYFGIDIGKEFNKIDRNITPADFYTSRFFHPMYLIP
jgi:hypothetical protein